MIYKVKRKNMKKQPRKKFQTGDEARKFENIPTASQPAQQQIGARQQRADTFVAKQVETPEVATAAQQTYTPQTVQTNEMLSGTTMAAPTAVTDTSISAAPITAATPGTSTQVATPASLTAAQMTAQTGKSVIYGSTKNVKFRSNRTDLVVEVLGMCDVQKGCESVRVALSLKPNSAAPQVFMGYFEKRGSDYVFTMSDPELKTFDQALATAGSAGSVTGGEPAPATDATTDQAKVPTQQTAPVVNPELPANKAGAKNPAPVKRVLNPESPANKAGAKNPAPVKRVLNPELPSNKVGAKNVPNLNQGATQQGLRDKQLDRSLKQKSLNQGAAQQAFRDKQLDRK